MEGKIINPKLQQLVDVLQDRRFHDDNSLGQKLGVSRTAIWKFIAQLEEYGIDIESIKSKGCCLRTPLQLLNAQAIESYLLTPEHRELLDLHIFETLGSTSDYLKSFLDKHKKPMIVCAAEHLTQARGRYQRRWYAPFAKNINLSCLTNLARDIGQLSGISLVMGLAITDTLKAFGVDKQLSLKWPNDVLWQGKKLAGILIDVYAKTHGHVNIIIGIGMNVNLGIEAAKHIDQAFVSISQINNRYHDRNPIIGVLLSTMINYLEQFKISGLENFMSDWQRYDHLKDKTITIINGKLELTGIAQGITNEGQLRLRLDDNTIKTCTSGDTSIKKLNW